jgi:acyl-CoA synthetase (AMP-forming)/AMP-acid ligase II
MLAISLIACSLAGIVAIYIATRLLARANAKEERLERRLNESHAKMHV